MPLGFNGLEFSQVPTPELRSGVVYAYGLRQLEPTPTTWLGSWILGTTYVHYNKT